MRDLSPKASVDARTPWGDILGYSRAVRIGNVIAVSGTAPSDESGKIVGRNDAYAQTAFAIRKIDAALKELGASLKHVVRTRIYTTDIAKWQEIAKAHREFFGESKPSNTMVQVTRLIDPEILVEIEVDAIMEPSMKR